MLTAKSFTSTINGRLKQAKQLDVRSREGLKPLDAHESEELAAGFAAHLGLQLSPDMRRRMSYPHLLNLYWEHPSKKESDSFNGEISLYNIADAVMTKDFSFLNYAENPDLEFLDVYRILDEHPHIGDGNTTVVGLNDDFTDVELFYLSEYKLYRLKLSYEEYLECLTTTLGYTNWQFLFCRELKPAMSRYMQKTYKPKLVKDLNTIWPGIDLEQFFALAERD